MKNWIVSMVVLIACVASLSAQVTQNQADEIVMERLRGEIRSYTLYADRRIRENTTISTSSEETVELSYPSRVYYIRYADASSGYLIVKESTGNLLEIRATNDSGPWNLPIWEVVLPKEIPFTEYSLEGTGCRLIYSVSAFDKVVVINSMEELENYINCTAGTYPEIDFSKYSLLLSRGSMPNGIIRVDTVFSQNSINRYTLKITVYINATTVPSGWSKEILVPKISDKAIVALEVQEPDY